MAEKLKLDSDVHELKLGKSFDPKSGVAFHSFRYDFKPESLDSTKSSRVEVEQNNSVTVNVPHVQSSGTSHTIYKGNKRPIQKECVLIIDHDTGEFRLEKLSNTIQLKKTRVEGSSKAARPHTPIEHPKHGEQLKKKEAKSSPHSKQHTQHVRKEPERVSPVSQLDVSSDSSSDSDMDISPPHKPSPPHSNDRFSNLSADLALSDSGSDSD